MSEFKYNYPMFGEEDGSRISREETLKYIKSQNPGGHHYSTSLGKRAFQGALSGLVRGALEGIISTVAIPMSLRKIKDRLPQNFTEVIDTNKVMSTRVFMAANHVSRLTTRLGIMGLAAYDMITDGDPILLTTNIASLVYEIYRSEENWDE